MSTIDQNRKIWREYFFEEKVESEGHDIQVVCPRWQWEMFNFPLKMNRTEAIILFFFFFFFLSFNYSVTYIWSSIDTINVQLDEFLHNDDTFDLVPKSRKNYYWAFQSWCSGNETD